VTNDHRESEVFRGCCCVCWQKDAAYERYESQLQEIQLDEQQAQNKADEEAKLEAEFALHKASATPHTDLSHKIAKCDRTFQSEYHFYVIFIGPKHCKIIKISFFF